METKNPALDAFRTRPAWVNLPLDLLSALVDKLRTIENIEQFIRLTEDVGLLENNIYPLVVLDQNVDFLMGPISTALTSYGNAAGERQELENAQRAFTLALLLNPRNPATLFGLGLVHTFSHNCREAALYFDQLLALKPDPNSGDALEGGLVDLEKTGMLDDFKRKALDLKLQCQEADRQTGSYQPKPTKTEFIKLLLRQRLEADGVFEQWLDEFNQMTEFQVMGTPEATLVTIVETYSELRRRGGLTDEAIFTAIERHRSTPTEGGHLPNPLTLQSYVFYRVELEHGHGELRITDRYVADLIRSSLAYFGP